MSDGKLRRLEAAAADGGVVAASRAPEPVPFRRVPKRSELIAADLVAYIADARLAPGTPLASERDMSEYLGVGRTSLREALRLLETRGVLTIKSGLGGGPIVRRPQPSDLREALTLILQFEETELTEVLEARRALELTVSRLAATRITPDEVGELRRINANLAAWNGDLDVVWESNKAFHLAIGEAGRNMVLRTFLESIVSMADGKVAGITYGARQVTAMVAAHERIIDALAEGDPDAAGHAMEEHLGESYRFWDKHYPTVTAQTVRWIQ
jgi:DNA-binding FadR family transcriptional regulator